jgi:hypothetical protein
MSREHGAFGEHDIAYFNGGLFSDDEAYELTTDDLVVLALATALDWSSIEPAIFGTLFERSLDPDKRSQLGAHYTSEGDIKLVVEPVLIEPLRKRWSEVQQKATELVEKAKGQQKASQRKSRKALSELLKGFAAELAAVRILDPACGSFSTLKKCLTPPTLSETRCFASHPIRFLTEEKREAPRTNAMKCLHQSNKKRHEVVEL